MKKILFATTALVATAGMAAAEINFSGFGRFGLRYQENNLDVEGEQETFLESRFRVNIDISAESDEGVRFSARVRMQTDDSGFVGTGDAARLNAARFSAEAGGLRIDVGNAAGAIDNLPNYYGDEPGLSNFVGQYSGVDYGFTGYSSGSSSVPQTLYARYAFDAFAVAASYTTTSYTTSTTTAIVDDRMGGFVLEDTNTITENDDRWDIHFAYSGDTFTVALGYGENGDDSLLVGTANFGFGPANITVFLADDDIDGDDAESGLAYGISGSFEVGAATDITFAYGDGEGDSDTRNIGIGFIHDLGGGVSLRGGIGESKSGDADGRLLGDLGVRFNF